MTRTIYSTEEVIEVLADLAGFTVTKNNEGYTIEPIDDDLKEFLQAETAADAYEQELCTAMASYGDDF